MKRAREEEPSSSSKPGVRQLSALRTAMEERSLHLTQEACWKSQTVTHERMIPFLQKRLADQKHARAQEDSKVFNYIRRQAVHCTQEQVEAARRTLLERHGSCYKLHDGLCPQLKLPCSAIPPSLSDEKSNKHIGVLQIPSYAVASIVDDNPTLDEALSRLGKLLCEKEILVGSHVCKSVCLAKNHVTYETHIINQQREFCPAYFVVKGKLVNFCTCGGGHVQCVIPGPKFQPQRFLEALAQVVGTTTQQPGF